MFIKNTHSYCRKSTRKQEVSKRNVKDSDIYNVKSRMSLKSLIVETDTSIWNCEDTS